jgi:hypothetical protein
LGSPDDHFALPAADVMYAVDSLPSPSSVLAHTQLALEQAQLLAQLLHPDVR